MRTYYENLQEMLALAEELRAKFDADGNADRAALYRVKADLHRAELATYDGRSTD
jgi:hypothetical protein